MSITVGELLEMPHLGLTLLAGERGLDRQVTWAHVSEMKDPAPWLEGGEMIMTAGIGVPRPSARQCAYVAHLDEHGVSGLAVSEDSFTPPITRAMRKEADSRSFPVLEVPLQVPFLAIARVVAAANEQGGQRRLLTHLRIFDTLAAATVEGVPREELFRRLERLTGYRLYLGSASGGQALEGVPAPPADLAKLLPRLRGQLPQVPGGYVVPVPLGGRVAAYLVAVETDHAALHGLPVLQHVAMVAALELANLAREREVLRREGAETLSELLAGVIGPEVAAKRLALAGFDPDDSLVLLAVRVETPQKEAVELGDAWNALGVPHLLLVQRELYALVPHHDNAIAVVAERSSVRAGASRPFHGVEGIGVAQTEALWAMQRAIDSHQSLVRFADRDRQAAWLPADARTLECLALNVLGRVMEYDARRGTDLVKSLRVWLDKDRKMGAAAQALRIHPHTLGYRLRKIEELTGMRTSVTSDVVELWLALRAMEAVNENWPPRPTQSSVPVAPGTRPRSRSFRR